jgi:hypothetical protein
LTLAAGIVLAFRTILVASILVNALVGIVQGDEARLTRILT